MPTYQYACTACGHRFEAVQSFSDASLTDCPECAGRLRKVFSSVGIVFKGSGFYRTDSRSGSGEKAGGESTGADAGGESSSGSSGKEGTKDGSAGPAKETPTKSDSGSKASGSSASSGSSGSSGSKSASPAAAAS